MEDLGIFSEIFWIAIVVERSGTTLPRSEATSREQFVASDPPPIG